MSSSRPDAQTGCDPRATLGRRTFISTVLAGGLLLPAQHALAQDSPPIEQADDETPAENEQIIEPEPEPTISPDEDADTVIQQTGTSEVRYFAETGHNLDSPFLEAWQLAGGADGPGVPISEPRFISDDGVVRQDFEALAFVYRPDAGDTGTIQGAPLPQSLVTSIAPESARRQVTSCPANDQGCQYVAETGHTVKGKLAAYWSDHGAYQLLGQPVSEQFTANGMTVQVFTCAVLEMDPSQTVRLRPVNAEHAASEYAGDAAFAPAPPTLGTTWLVRADGGLNIRSGAGSSATVIAVVPDNAEFIAAPDANGAWIPGYADGVAGWVSSQFLTTTENLPAPTITDWRLDVWEGATLGDTNFRRDPSTSSATVETVTSRTPVVVVDWVEGEAVVENQITWARLESGSYVYARNIGRAAPVEPPPLPADAPSEGRWIDVHITQQLMVAYEGREPVRTVVMTSGQPGWETPTGFYRINNRVANETMESGSIGAESFYVLKNVLFTQYFTDRGHALHYAWWKNEETIGRPGSHGCLNLLLDDAQFFWDWATIGTPVVCRTG